MHIAGLILSILGLVGGLFSWVPVLSYFSLPISIVGLVLSCIARKKNPCGPATAGMVIGIIAVVISGIFFIACSLCAACAVAAY